MRVKSANERFAASVSSAVSKSAKALRLAAYVVVISAAASATWLHQVRADVNEALLGLGAAMMQMPGAPAEESREIHLNGARLFLRAQTLDRALPEVLAHYRRVCSRGNARLFDELDGVLGESAGLPSGALASLATASASSDEGGYVACVDPTSSSGQAGAFIERVLALARTGDLRELGGLRFAYAQRAGGNPSNRTLLLTLWSDFSLDLRRMLPNGSADADGRDLQGFPRAPATQRILSSWESERPSGVFIYLAPGRSPDELDSFYRRVLPAQGWNIIDRSTQKTDDPVDLPQLLAQQGQRTVVIRVHASEAGSTILTILSSEPS